MKSKKHGVNINTISKYLPVFIILLALSIIIGSTFAYFTDKTEEESTLTFSKVELSGETTTGINGKLRDVIPGTPLVDGALKFSKSIDSEAIYVRAKISFSLPVEYANDNDMKQMVDLLRSATDFNIVNTEQHGAVWSAKDGNYFYLMEAVSEGEPTNLMRVDTIDTYTLSNEVVVPRDLESLPDNAQYMKSINFHIAFEAIQADNVSSVLSETKETFNAIFPENDDEKPNSVQVTFKGFDGSDFKVEELEVGSILNEPELDIPLDANNEPIYLIEGWYSDSAYTNKFKFGQVVEDGLTLYPLVYEVSQGLLFAEVEENDVIVGYSVSKGTCSDTFVVVPNTYKGLPVIQVANSGFSNMSSLNNIILPSTITSIKSWAFDSCTSLALTSVPSGITSIEEWAFVSCTSLPSNDSVYYLGVEGTNNTIVVNVKSTSITSVDWPDNVMMIAGGAFSSCSELNLTSLPNTITYIGRAAFTGCGNLALTSLPSNLTYMGMECFSGCSNLALTELPSGLTSIESFTFNYCTNLKSILLPNTITYISFGVFEECINLTLISLPSNISGIGYDAFRHCSNLTYILCETEAVATLMQGQGFADSYIYVKNADTYSGLTETEIVINDSLTIYQVERSGYMWIRNGSDYYKCVYMHDTSYEDDSGSYDDPIVPAPDDWFE